MKNYLMTVTFAAMALITPNVDASSCDPGFFSTEPALCGQVNVGGVGSTSNGFVNIIQRPLPVLAFQIGLHGSGHAGTVGAGPGAINGSAFATASFGEVHARAFANNGQFDTPNFDHSNEGFVHSTASAGFVDGFSVNGSHPVNIHIVSSLEGSFTGIGNGQVNFALSDVTLPAGQFLIHPGTVSGPFGSNLGITPPEAYNITLFPDHKYLFWWVLSLEANSSNNTFPVIRQSSADASNTGRLSIDVMTPGATLNTLSGHDYSSSITTTPLPSSISLFIIGLAGIIASHQFCNGRRGLSF